MTKRQELARRLSCLHLFGLLCFRISKLMWQSLNLEFGSMIRVNDLLLYLRCNCKFVKRKFEQNKCVQSKSDETLAHLIFSQSMMGMTSKVVIKRENNEEKSNSFISLLRLKSRMSFQNLRTSFLNFIKRYFLSHLFKVIIIYPDRLKT